MLGKGGEFQDPCDLLRLSSPKQRRFLTAALCGASARQCGIGEMSGVQSPLVFLSLSAHMGTRPCQASSLRKGHIVTRIQ